MFDQRFARSISSLILFVAMFVASGGGAIAAPSAGDFTREPDVTINTKSLFKLPKDIVSVPILKDLLTEDFVFYYRDSGADWLSFRGALARLAFENSSDWPTKLTAWILNGPAEVALWAGADGKLNHFLVVVDQTGVKALFEFLAKIAASDSQLKRQTIGGREVQVLTLATGRLVYLATEENRLFVFSDSSMSLPVAATGRSIVDRTKSFFGLGDGVSIYGPRLGKADHVATVAASYLSFGYQAFFSGLRSLRFDFVDKLWETQVFRADGLPLVDTKDWAQMPRGAAFCVAVPIDRKKVGAIVKAASWLDKAYGNAVACWYPGSKIYTPMIALRGGYGTLAGQNAELKTVFSSLIGARESLLVKGVNDDDSPTLKWLPALPVVEEKLGAGRVGYTREVGGRYGTYASKQSKMMDKLGSRRFFRVRLVATPDTILFSPDDQLIERGLLTLDGKFPSMAASLTAKAKTPSFVLAPDAFSKLAKQTILESLPESQESIFRTAISRHLFPNLEKFGKGALQTASLSDGKGWSRVEWVSHVAR
ncbi:MAG: DUF2138 family protein [Bdellovibrionales bacterium]|nr:DUF2138 family protein [Bdellovibrionales bacterium]